MNCSSWPVCCCSLASAPASRKRKASRARSTRRRPPANARTPNCATAILVYLREAHPDSILLTLKDGEKKLLKIPQTEKVEDRSEVAKQCVATLKMTMPTLTGQS